MDELMCAYTEFVTRSPRAPNPECGGVHRNPRPQRRDAERVYRRYCTPRSFRDTPRTIVEIEYRVEYAGGGAPAAAQQRQAPAAAKAQAEAERHVS